MDRILKRVLIASVDTIGECLASEGFQMFDNEAVVLDYLKCRDLVVKQKAMATRQTEKQVINDCMLWAIRHEERNWNILKRANVCYYNFYKFWVWACEQVFIVAVILVGFPSYLQGKIDWVNLRKARETIIEKTKKALLQLLQCLRCVAMRLFDNLRHKSPLVSYGPWASR